jgi:hypothetical protein
MSVWMRTAVFSMILCAGASWGGPIPGHVADYNAADVRQSNGALVVPAGVATYTATAAIPTGSTFLVTLPSGFTFASVPSLTTSGTATFTLSGGGMGAQAAAFTVGTANVTAGQTISLAGFSISGATALKTVTPVANALPVTMQAIGVDATPLSFGAFASDVGAVAYFVGAIQFIDINAPSNATEFLGSPDSRTAVFAATAISAQTTDAATGTVPILKSDGTTNSLSNTDTATFTINANFGGIASVFTSSTSDCSHTISTGAVYPGSAVFSNVAVGTEIFFCMTASASGPGIQDNPNGFTNLTVTPSSSTTDFLSANVVNEYPGLSCYSKGNGCVAYTLPTVPALSDWGMTALAALMAWCGTRLVRLKTS